MKSPKDIARRCLIQGALSFRGQLVNQLNRGVEKAAQILDAHTQWLHEFDLVSSMDDQEQRLLEQPADAWPDETITACFWKIESFKALLWVLSRDEPMPVYFHVGNVRELYKRAVYPKDPTAFLDQTQTRSEDDIQKERRVYEFLHWRCRTELMRLDGMQPPPGETYAGTVKRALEHIPSGITALDHDGDDLLINGVTFCQFQDLGTVISTSYERHLAFNWVLGDDTWADTHTDT